jgi:hypothetical protein
MKKTVAARCWIQTDPEDPRRMRLVMLKEGLLSLRSRIRKKLDIFEKVFLPLKRNSLRSSLSAFFLFN